MRWTSFTRLTVGIALTLCVAGSHILSAQELALAPSKPGVPGLGERGSILSLSVSPMGDQDQAVALRGSDARLQLMVTGKFSAGQLHDLTRNVAFETSEPGIVRIDETGLVTPMSNGTVTVMAKAAGGVVGKTVLAVHDFEKVLPINFPNQISPIFTKLGCNGGGCHGKASGQNGFKLSLLGFYPDEDFEYLVKEGRGRRLFPAAPERSLLLRKATNSVPHGGGHRMDVGSHEYRLLHRWIAQGMPYGHADDPVVERIEILPKMRTMGNQGKQQLRVVAHYSDGSTDDVTRVAQYEANNTEMAETNDEGLVETLDLTGDVAIMARYQSQVDVFRASIPLGIHVDNLPSAGNFIDEHVFAKLETLGIPPSEVCDDSTFIRRASVDIAGHLPTPAEVHAFLADDDPAKRDKLVDRLVDSAGYADYFANKWSAVLRNKRRNDNQKRGTFAFHSWIRSSLYYNKPYDQFVREVLAASGEVGQNPPVIWYREVKDATQQVEDAAQLFLGLRIQCARCHHHPFEKWSQDDYYSFAAFFSRVGRKNGTQPDEQRIFHNPGNATARNPKSGQNLKPTGLDADPLQLAADEDPRQALVDWMSAPSNPFFAHSLVNRYWKHFFDRGLVDPEDDMRVTNPASNPELLDSLAQHFIESGFDLKDLVRTICKSTTYQLSSEPNEYNLSDKQNYSRYYPKRLTAEVLYDALNQATNTSAGFGGLPAGTRAVELPDQGANNYFLTVFGRPQSDTACECERSQEANLAQSLHLLNSSEVQGKLSDANGRAAALAKNTERSIEEKISELYFWVYARPAVDDEIAIARAHVEKNENKQQAYEDILWALVNTKEFLFNH